MSEFESSDFQAATASNRNVKACRRYRMRADAHYVELLSSRAANRARARAEPARVRDDQARGAPRATAACSNT